MIGVFHIHTSYSFDANVSPKRVIEQLQRLGVNFAAITDHETIQGALEAKTIAPPNLIIIVGAEYHTEKGDIMGLFLEKEIKSRKSDEVIKEIKSQNGIIVLPHPYKAHRLDPEFIQSVDVIEIYNSRASKTENAKALALAKEYRKPGIVGSDAHFLQEIGLTLMEFHHPDLKLAILNGQGKIIRTQKSTFFYPIGSGLINLYTTKNPHLIIKWGRKLILRSLFFFK